MPLTAVAATLLPQANVDRSVDPSTWNLDSLAGKMAQYCYLLEGLTGAQLADAAKGDFEALRAHLRELAVGAYNQKVQLMEEFEPGLMKEAQRYFVTTQTDNLWKEHLQVSRTGVGGAHGALSALLYFVGGCGVGGMVVVAFL